MKRLRSESNRRWRICNPPANPALSAENLDLTAAVTAFVTTPNHAEPPTGPLAALFKAFATLSPEQLNRMSEIIERELGRGGQ